MPLLIQQCVVQLLATSVDAGVLRLISQAVGSHFDIYHPPHPQLPLKTANTKHLIFRGQCVVHNPNLNHPISVFYPLGAHLLPISISALGSAFQFGNAAAGEVPLVIQEEKHRTEDGEVQSQTAQRRQVLLHLSNRLHAIG